MRVVIVSRIHSPEPSAASFMLDAIERELVRRGHEASVLTVKPPRGMAPRDVPGVRVRRASVLRDATGYVRGYLPYLSFDLKVAFRMLLTPRADVYIVEPPPTTGAVVRVACAFLRRPYVYDVADLWSDAAAVATSSRLVLWMLRKTELFALRGARHAFAVSPGIADRMREIGVNTPTTIVRFGADTNVFRYARPEAANRSPFFIYAGTYSEWQGAAIFIDAYAQFVGAHSDYRLVFVGNGSDRALLERKKEELGLEGVEFLAPIDGASLNTLLSSATASLVSLRPGQGYDYAFPSKIYSSIASGCPVVYAGRGQPVDFVMREARDHAIGLATDYDSGEVAAALATIAANPVSQERRKELSTWASETCSLSAAAETVVDVAEAATSGT